MTRRASARRPRRCWSSARSGCWSRAVTCTRTSECVDLLSDGDSFIELTGPRYETENTHGGGDTLASAITASLAKGASVPDAVAAGKKFIERCVAEAYPLGAGVGPVSPFWVLTQPRAST